MSLDISKINPSYGLVLAKGVITALGGYVFLFIIKPNLFEKLDDLKLILLATPFALMSACFNGFIVYVSIYKRMKYLDESEPLRLAFLTGSLFTDMIIVLSSYCYLLYGDKLNIPQMLMWCQAVCIVIINVFGLVIHKKK